MARTVKIHQVDAFTTTTFTGNPAGVVFGADALTDVEMLAIARELNNADTSRMTPEQLAQYKKTVQAVKDKQQKQADMAEFKANTMNNLAQIKEMWAKAEAGTLDAGEARRFSSLMAHEYVEKDLMAAGMPYRSAHPAAWANERALNPSHFGAHEAAPRSSDGTLTQWEKLGLTPPEAPIAPDLSNIDDVINAARRGLNL